MENINLENMERIDVPRIDKTQYVGQKTKIAKVEIVDTKFGKAVEVVSETLEIIERLEKDDIVIVASKLFSLSDESKIVVDGKLDKFLTQNDCKQPKDLIGKEVEVFLNEKNYLTF